jgi:CubicO group peptidase (beta-lactamase class C family)
MKSVLKWLGIIVAVIALIAGGWFWSIGPDMRGLILDPPKDANILFWSQSQREIGFKMMDELPALVKSVDITPSTDIRELPVGEPLSVATSVDAFFEEQSLAGMLVLHEGNIRIERYGLGLTPERRWTSFSVAKSFTSNLVGIAIKEGDINSIDDNVADYIEGLKDSAYDGVSIGQLLTMTSGVDWNEDYSDPQSDVALFNNHIATDGLPTIVSYMRGLSRAHPPGEQWLYSTGETNLIGILVEQATQRSLADYFSEKIWQPFGMADRATWLLGADGNEISGCCVQASLRDFARYGLFVLEDGNINGSSILPDNWLSTATTKQADIGITGSGYGYQWWTFDDGTFTARGIFGQTIFIDPGRQLVVAFNGNWPNARETKLNDERFEFIEELQKAVDDEANGELINE